jgi:hypothetical protein
LQERLQDTGYSYHERSRSHWGATSIFYLKRPRPGRGFSGQKNAAAMQWNEWLSSSRFHAAAFGCKAGRLRRTAWASSGRTPTACANGMGVRRMPRFFIKKSKYDDSAVTMCLSIIGCKHVLHDMSSAGRLRFMRERALLGRRGSWWLWTIRQDSASYGRHARRAVTAFEAPMNLVLAGFAGASRAAQAQRPLGRRSSSMVR